ncbi:MAG TPA: EF-P lysine aminoacylase GenX [Magnetococcales bacterium]|nr:EF-P lysine aminoacylase GenX [Magnetococcales bacterium]
MSNAPRVEPQAWHPTASLETLRHRGVVMRQIREFFFQRGVLEVNTPVWLPNVAPERHQTPPACSGGYLQTSPETCMKRLLAAGLGAIYQMGPAFRAGESGRLHHPEFTMLEWYRPHWTLTQLMDEVTGLIQTVLPLPSVTTMTFQDVFLQHVGVDPFFSPLEELTKLLGPPALPTTDRALLVDRLFVERLEPALAKLDTLLVVTGFPPWEPGMAEIDPGPPAVARRFEVFIHGVEIANAYQELQNPVEQEQRLIEANRARVKEGGKSLPIDERFLQALRAGLPPCAGVALGLDRLLMLAFAKKSIAEVIAFCDPIHESGTRLRNSSTPCP